MKSNKELFSEIFSKAKNQLSDAEIIERAAKSEMERLKKIMAQEGLLFIDSLRPYEIQEKTFRDDTIAKSSTVFERVGMAQFVMLNYFNNEELFEVVHTIEQMKFKQAKLNGAINDWFNYPEKDTRLIDLALAEGADIDALGEDGHAPLHRAAERGDLELIKVLLESGADINARNEKGQTAARTAQMNNKNAATELINSDYQSVYFENKKLMGEINTTEESDVRLDF